MTPAEIDALPAGRELDAVVAERVMDDPPTYQIVLDGTSRSRQYSTRAAAEVAREILAKRYLVGEIEVGDDVRDYSTDIAAAWEVVEKLGTWHGFDFLVWKKEGELWQAGWYEDGYDGPEGRAWAHADTAPLAICRAALKVVGAHA